MKTFKKARTKVDIQNDERVDSIHYENDPDSWWCYLKPGWQWDNNEQHTIHETTIKEVCSALNYGVTVWEKDPDLRA